MKVRASVKPVCEKCKVVKRGRRVYIICEQAQTKAGLAGGADGSNRRG